MTTAIPNYPKRASNRERILDLLSDYRQHHMTQLEAIGGMRFGARIFELRKLGHDIETVHLGADETCYVMHPSEPKQGSLL